MKFSIIIPTYKRKEDLCLCLDCLAHYCDEDTNHKWPFELEVIVSDDAQDDNLKVYIAEHYSWISYLEGPRRGPAANRNNGAKNSSGEWLVFTDDDCLPQSGWLEAYFEEIDSYDVIEGKTIADRPRERMDEESPVNETGNCLWACNFAIKKTVFDKLSGFDEEFPSAAMEDMDFHLRLKQIAATIVFSENALVVHPWRKAKAWAFRKKHLASLEFYWKKHPQKVPENKFIYFLRLSWHSAFKHPFREFYATKLRGYSLALENAFFWLYTAILSLFKS